MTMCDDSHHIRPAGLAVKLLPYRMEDPPYLRNSGRFMRGKAALSRRSSWASLPHFSMRTGATHPKEYRIIYQ
jgi:hypothetical protein